MVLCVCLPAGFVACWGVACPAVGCGYVCLPGARATQAWFQACLVVSLSVDSSRIGGKATVAGAIVGRPGPAGPFKAAWLVPQDGSLVLCSGAAAEFTIKNAF